MEAAAVPTSLAKSQENVAISSSGSGNSQSSGAATSSVYLNQSSPTRHVTVIPINSIVREKEDTSAAVLSSSPSKGGTVLSSSPAKGSSSPTKGASSPTKE